MHAASLLSPDDQRVTFVELFFDLVFVFAITQVTHAAAHHLDATGVLQSLLVFWLIWWGWSQYTWALNAANTEHPRVRLSALVAAGVAFVMAVAADGAPRADRDHRAGRVARGGERADRQWRATGRVLRTRLAVLAATLAGLLLTAGTSGPVILGVGCAGLGLLVAIEQVTDKPRIEPAGEPA